LRPRRLGGRQFARRDPIGPIGEQLERARRIEPPDRRRHLRQSLPGLDAAFPGFGRILDILECARDRARRLVAERVAAIAAVGVSIMLMGSRNGLLSFALLCGIGFFIHLKNKSLNFQFLMVVLAIIAGAITIALSLNSPTVQRAIYMTETRGGGDRVYYWQAGAKALWEYPVFGMGGDESASQGVVAAYAPPGVQDKVMHNTYMEMAVEYGLFGGIFYIIFLIFTLTWGYRLYRYALQKKDLVIAAPAISYLILMVAAIFISDIWDTAIWYNLSMVLAPAIQLVYHQYINKRKVNNRLTYAESVVT